MPYHGQHGRQAFGPGRRRSQAALAWDIAASIRQHQAAGQHRTVAQYTANPETRRLVTALLTA